ncbi:MAG: hypothetical protein IJU69_06410 [Bacteroidales bacterium]|nr:hypothetical protein [Bacteroidales bacterium]
MTISQIVEKRLRRTKGKSLLFASDFPQYDQDYIADLLSNYVKEGKLLRLANGVYLKTTVTKFGPVFPSPMEIAEAIARRDHAQVLMSGLTAENYFGLSTQVPMKIVFLTSGSARKLTVGNSVIEFKRGVPKNFAFKDKTMATLCLAMKSIGDGHVTDEQKSVLRNFLNDYLQSHDIKSDLKLMPQWIQKILNGIINK